MRAWSGTCWPPSIPTSQCSRCTSLTLAGTTWRVGHDLSVRTPRREAATGLALHEQRWLPQVARFLTLPVPVPMRFGHPNDVYPWHGL